MSCYSILTKPSRKKFAVNTAKNSRNKPPVIPRGVFSSLIFHWSFVIGHSDLIMILCADDYGLSEDIDRAILELCRSGRLTAVSCMVALERCSAESLRELLAHQKKWMSAFTFA